MLAINNIINQFRFKREAHSCWICSIRLKIKDQPQSSKKNILRKLVLSINNTNWTIILLKLLQNRRLYCSIFMDSTAMEELPPIWASTLLRPSRMWTFMPWTFWILASQRETTRATSNHLKSLWTKLRLLLILYCPNFRKNQKPF